MRQPARSPLKRLIIPPDRWTKPIDVAWGSGARDSHAIGHAGGRQPRIPQDPVRAAPAFGPDFPFAAASYPRPLSLWMLKAPSISSQRTEDPNRNSSTSMVGWIPVLASAVQPLLRLGRPQVRIVAMQVQQVASQASLLPVTVQGHAGEETFSGPCDDTGNERDSGEADAGRVVSAGRHAPPVLETTKQALDPVAPPVE